MKRITIIIASIVFIGVICASCNNYVCPAYSQDAPHLEQKTDLNS